MSLLSGHDLYEVLAVPRSVGQAELAKAYRQAAFQNHPDRQKGGRKDATERFQRVGLAYAVLKDPVKRARYDRNGHVDDDAEITGDESIGDFVSAMFPKPTLDDVSSFMTRNKGSAVERALVCKVYKKTKGDFFRVFDEVCHDTLSVEEEDRMHAMIAGMIEEGTLKATAKWQATRPTPELRRSKEYKLRWSKMREEAEEAERELEELVKKQPGLRRKKGRKSGMELAVDPAKHLDALMAGLESKYKCKIPEFDEAEFEEARKRVMARGAAKAGVAAKAALPAKSEPSVTPRAKRRKKTVQAP
eukprot:TRINITY_DN14282_c0_g1_i1.p1 TRINITY_DN14282_c0_g1~~TRINITY_DN14282_c0_g1_i1.p1  ORF type:complete len:303 (+),score=88.86 TRINITY_DN14282_c0_g1_i1:56-964(+)